MSDSELKGSAKLGTYLKQLRQGYGFSLRKVEEKARQAGGEIDNSQLSRYEKGRCYPSFDKLRVLAGIFNVSIQSFSDIVDLEEYEQLRRVLDEYRRAMAMLRIVRQQPVGDDIHAAGGKPVSGRRQ